MAGEKGLEPLLLGPKPGVLPLDDSPINTLEIIQKLIIEYYILENIILLKLAHK